MANLLHELADIVHCFGNELKNAADKFEHLFIKDVAPVAEDAAKAAAESVIKDS